MKKTTVLTCVLIFLVSWTACNSQSGIKEASGEVKSTDVNIYYFHFTRRCATCLAVEENARKAVEALYSDKIKTGEITFASINLDDDASKEIAARLGIGGQTLLIVRGDKKTDITDKGFLNAHNPDKMKEEIKSGVDKVLF